MATFRCNECRHTVDGLGMPDACEACGHGEFVRVETGRKVDPKRMLDDFVKLCAALVALTLLGGVVRVLTGSASAMPLHLMDALLLAATAGLVARGSLLGVALGVLEFGLSLVVGLLVVVGGLVGPAVSGAAALLLVAVGLFRALVGAAGLWYLKKGWGAAG